MEPTTAPLTEVALNSKQFFSRLVKGIDFDTYPAKVAEVSVNVNGNLAYQTITFVRLSVVYGPGKTLIGIEQGERWRYNTDAYVWGKFHHNSKFGLFRTVDLRSERDC